MTRRSEAHGFQILASDLAIRLAVHLKHPAVNISNDQQVSQHVQSWKAYVPTCSVSLPIRIWCSSWVTNRCQSASRSRIAAASACATAPASNADRVSEKRCTTATYSLRWHKDNLMLEKIANAEMEKLLHLEISGDRKNRSLMQALSATARPEIFYTARGHV